MKKGVALFAVDRVEGAGAGATVVLVGARGVVVEVQRKVIGRLGVEGAVLRVPVLRGVPQWQSATRDREEEKRRKAAAQATLRALRAGDRGGDVVL